METNKLSSRHRDYVLSVTSGNESNHSVDTKISRSWRRCTDRFGLDPARKRESTIAERTVLQEHQHRLRDLLAIAKAEMANLSQQIAGTGHSILLADDSGMVLNYAGDPTFDSTARKTGLQEGAIWSEQYQGTNGMGTCLVEQQPLIIHQNEHFLVSNVVLTCTASPIFGPDGQLLAVLDASSESIKAQQHTLALVNMAAKTMENRVFLCMFKNHFIMHFHSRPEFVNTLGEGLIAFQSDGAILAANRSTLFQLGLKSTVQIQGKKIDEVFDSALPLLMQHSHYSSLHAIPIHEAEHGRRFFAMIQTPESKAYHSRRTPPDAVTSNPRVERVCSGPLDELEFGDLRMAQNIRIAHRVLDRDIPILLSGESGTGKGVFAKAMHQASERADKPFVSINCASIPESLIESELFGYKAGAFTGASRHGSMGKIVQADGGTLFLDEIGDMPLPLQARLLRVLEEKEVVPLGGHTAVSVDLRVISASHRTLSVLVTERKFREDLYYRLEGIKLTLPPLRDRTDKYNLTKHLIDQEIGTDAPIQFDEEVINRLVSYSWPGNIRQLRNALRATIALRGSDHITVDDLVENLFQDAQFTNETSRTVLGDSEESYDPLLNAEREALIQELELCRWNVSNAAKHLSLSRNTLYRKMKRCNITPPR